MSKHQEFVDWVENLIRGQEEPCEPTEGASAYWEALKTVDVATPKSDFTPNGKMILKYLQETSGGMYKAKDIAEGLFISSKTVSGAIRKLVTDGYVEKVGKDPVIYTITEKGKNVDLSEGEN